VRAPRILLGLALFAAFAPLAVAEGSDAAPALPDDAARLEARKAFDEGELRREEGKWAEAAKAYGKSLDRDEGQYLVHLRYQEAVIASGDAASLRAEYDAIVKDRPDDLAAKLHRLRLEDPATRIKPIQELLAQRSAEPMLHLELGRAYLAKGDAAAAKKPIESAWKIAPDFGDAFLLSCEALRRTGDGAGARLRLEDALKQKVDLYEAALRLSRMDLAEGKPETALAHADRVLTLRPTHLAALLLKSEASSRLGKADEALTALDAAARVNPNDVDVLVALADLTAKGGSEDALKRAVETYKKALAVPNAPQLRAFYGLGWAQERLNLLKEAAEAYREASLLAPSDAGVVNSVGVVLLKQRRYAEAVVQFKKAIDLDRTSPEAYANLATVAEEQSDWKAAIDWYAKVLAIKGQDKNLRAILNSAFDHEELTQFKKAETLLEKARAIRPEDSEIVTFYGDNMMFQKKWKPAVKAYQEGVRLDEKNRYAWRGLGLALAQDGKAQDAVDALEKAKALKGDDILTLIVLGDLYMSEIENLEKALENYQAYVKAGGNNPDVPMLIDQIQQELQARKAGGGTK